MEFNEKPKGSLIHRADETNSGRTEQEFGKKN